MEHDVTYRTATVDDLPAIWQVRTASIRALCRGHYGETAAERWASAPMPDEFADVIRTRDTLGAECKGALVGYGVLNRQAAALEALFVAPGFVGRGIGTSILRSLEATALQAKLKSIQLSASLNAVAFYRGAGYQAIVETIWQHPAGFQLPCVLMSKDLTIGHE